MPNTSLINETGDGGALTENPGTPGGVLTNRYLEEIRQKELAKKKLIKMTAY